MPRIPTNEPFVSEMKTNQGSNSEVLRFEICESTLLNNYKI